MTLKNQLTLLIEQSELSLTENQIDLLIQYVELLNKWNKAYNLTAVRDTTDKKVYTKKWTKEVFNQK